MNSDDAVAMPMAIATFVQLLRQRLASNVFTTEDSVRYTFFAALLQHGITPDRVILEAPYEHDPRKKLDTFVSGTSHARPIAIEFKYTRALPGGGAVPRPMLAGAIFADLGRLLFWPDPADRYLVYLTGPELYKYLTVPHARGLFGRSSLSPIFTSRQPGNVSHNIDATSFTGLPDTFNKYMGTWPGSTTIMTIVSEALPRDHYMWIFQIKHNEVE